MWSRISFQDLGISYIIIYNGLTKRVKVAEWLWNQFIVQVKQVRAPARENVCLLFSSDIVNLLLDTNGREKQKA